MSWIVAHHGVFQKYYYGHHIGEDPNLTLTRYALERLLYRLAHSEYSGQFILKGAMRFGLWMESDHRPTRDLDLLGFGEPSNERRFETTRDWVLAVRELELASPGMLLG